MAICARARRRVAFLLLCAPAENSTLALLAEKGISYETKIENRDFPPFQPGGCWQWALVADAPFCFFIVVAGAVTLLRRRDHQPSEPRPIAAARNERRVDKAFAALAACGMVAVAVLLGLTTDWKIRRVAADQVPGIIAQHKNARFEVFEYEDGSRKLWISDLRSPDFIAPADESTLGLLTRQGITYQTYLAGIGWWYRHPGMIGTSSAQPKPLKQRPPRAEPIHFCAGNPRTRGSGWKRLVVGNEKQAHFHIAHLNRKRVLSIDTDSEPPHRRVAQPQTRWGERPREPDRWVRQRLARTLAPPQRASE